MRKNKSVANRVPWRGYGTLKIEFRYIKNKIDSLAKQSSFLVMKGSQLGNLLKQKSGYYFYFHKQGHIFIGKTFKNTFE